MAHQKREGSSTDDDCASKCLKGTDTASETGGSVEASVSQETGTEVTRTCQQQSEAPSEKCVLDGKAAANSKVSGEQNMVLTAVEGDAAEDKGCRHTMEDAWVLLPNAGAESPGSLRCAHFAIYDGHGGRLAADFAQKHLHQNVIAAGFPRELMDVKAAKKAIIEGFRRTDESLLQESSKGNWQDGATAVCVWILGQMAGGSVGSNGRLQGRIEVSRAFGERQFKKVGLIATPDVHSFELTKKDHFIILGCDGLWGVFGPNDAVEFVQNQLKETSSASLAVRRFVKEAVRERRCKDNCTAVLIVFKH
ncbi:putative protein phosphatase 2C 67 [Panicum miliaceum]|uniref:protein-serine/threonine phosphatase n=1 Tax=Panicum miliaceum TaxID=4540 RepID=A0A3L6TCS9_PANMI|nr:putative protein phosphatase 2C 67 [Panicum miliaceum]